MTGYNKSTAKVGEKKLWITIGILILLTVVVVVALPRHPGENTEVALVNGEPISVKEFQQQLQYYHRAETINHFQQQFNVQQEKNFWDTEYNGITPANYAKERALKSCIAVKIQEIAMKEYNLVKDISYQQFLKEWKQENDNRRKAVKEGRVIYGPQEYSENEYFVYLFSNRVHTLKQELAKKQFQVTEEALLSHYESEKEVYYRKADNIQTRKISIPFTEDTREEAFQEALLVEKRINQGDNFKVVAEEYGGAITQTFDASTDRTDSRYNEPFKLEVMTFLEGEVRMIEEETCFSIVLCEQKQENGFYPFEEVQEQVWNHYVDEQYEQWLEKKIDNAVVELKTEVLERIKVE